MHCWCEWSGKGKASAVPEITAESAGLYRLLKKAFAEGLIALLQNPSNQSFSAACLAPEGMILPPYQ
jgi:hypothetical protein